MFVCNTMDLTFEGNSGYDFAEFASNLKQAFSDCKVVDFLEKFTNFSETVQPYLNVASTTPGSFLMPSF